MYAMQYELPLPADYDMQIIHTRVKNRGHRTDDFAGLGLKAYLVRERGVDGSPVNEYAPFYLWAATEGMNRFLWGGGGFRGIVDDFGRPAVRHWTGVAAVPGPARAGTVRTATRSLSPIPAGVDPTAVVEAALDGLRQRAQTPGVYCSAVAVDPRHWELLHFTLWTEDSAPDAAGTRYGVLHLSTPHLHTIENGRQW